MDPSRLGLLSNGLPSAVASTPRPVPPLQRETEVTETPIINSIEMGAEWIEKQARSTAMVVSVNQSTVRPMKLRILIRSLSTNHLR